MLQRQKITLRLTKMKYLNDSLILIQSNKTLTYLKDIPKDSNKNIPTVPAKLQKEPKSKPQNDSIGSIVKNETLKNFDYSKLPVSLKEVIRKKVEGMNLRNQLKERLRYRTSKFVPPPRHNMQKTRFLKKIEKLNLTVAERSQIDKMLNRMPSDRRNDLKSKEELLNRAKSDPVSKIILIRNLLYF